MDPTEAEGVALDAEPSGRAVTGPEGPDPLATFLQSVQAMVHEGTDPTTPAKALEVGPQTRRDRRAARRAAKADRRREDKLLRAERRSARRSGSRRRAAATEVVPVVPAEPARVVPAPPSERGRVPAQAPEPELDVAETTAVGEVAAAVDQAQRVPGRRAGRRQRRQQEARAVSVPPPDLDPPADGFDEEGAQVPVEAGLAGITFTPADPMPVRRTRGARKRERRRDAARAVAAAVPTAELVEPATEPPGGPPADLQTPASSGPDTVVPDAPGGAAGGSDSSPPADRAPRVSRRERRRERREARALAKTDAADPGVGDDAPPPASGDESLDRPPAPARPSRRERRRERREQRALAKAVAAATARGESADRRVEPETLAEYLARVESPRLPRRARRSRPRTPLWLRRTLKIGSVVVLVAACATLPWVAPQVPDLLSGALPGHGTTPVRVEDPPASAPTDAVVGPVGVGQLSGPYAGVRLLSAGWPREVVVERLHVDSQVEPISGQSGSLLPPSDPQVLGWWKEGRPVGAQYGTAVITGHTVHTGGGALDHLDKLVVGDTVRVRTDAGWIRYAVQRTQIYSTAQLARDAKDVFRLGGSGRLVLITCDDWDGHEYRSNAVVVATPVLDEPSGS